MHFTMMFQATAGGPPEDAGGSGARRRAGRRP